MNKLKLMLPMAILSLLWPGAAWSQSPPANFQVISGPSENLLTWDGVQSADHYSIQRSTNSGGPYTTIAGYISNSILDYTDTAVTNGLEYYYLATAVFLQYDAGGQPYYTNLNSPEMAAIPLASGSNYTLVNCLSGLALNSSFGLAFQNTYNGAASEIWKLVAVEGGYFAIFNGSPNATLTGATPSSQLTVTSYNSVSNQLWYFQVTNGAAYTVHNLGTGQVLDDFGASLNVGTDIGQWVQDGGTNQNWAVAQPAPPVVLSASLTNNALPSHFTFYGQINPNGLPTTVICSLGTSTNYNFSMTNLVPAASDPVSFSFTLPYAVDSLTIHGQLTAQNAVGATNSGDLTFVFQPPQIQSATLVSDGQYPQAYASAQINPNGSPTTVIIQFGTNTAYGTTVTNTSLVSVVTNGFQPVSNTIGYPDLNVTTTLHAFITVSNLAGTVTSGDLTGNSLLFQNVYGSSFTWFNSLTGSAAWADLDNDGWLDLAVEGWSKITSDLGYTSGSTFYNPGTNQAYRTEWTNRAALVSGIRSAIGLGDLDNDNYPDLLLACGPFLSGFLNYFLVDEEGSWSARAVIQYGSGSQEFAVTNSTILSGLEVINASVAMGDFAHTGREGALVCGIVGTGEQTMDFVGSVSMLYQNNDISARASGILENLGPLSALQPVNTSVPPAWGFYAEAFCSGQTVLVAGDFDNDGFPDLFLLNFISSDSRPSAAFFHGDGNGGFTMTSNTFLLYPSLPGIQGSYVETASCVLADMNGDGYLDMVLSYGNQCDSAINTYISGTTAGIWLNDGHGNLTNSGIVLPQLGLANLAVGDIFNHGRNDILMVGYANQNYGNYNLDSPPMETVALRNDGNGVFTPVVLGNFGSIGETGHGLQLADFDNDGRLDFVMTGDDDPAQAVGNAGITPFIADTRIFRNVMNIPSNAPPAAPPNLSTTVGNGTVTFHWGNATDDITPANLLTYNLRVGTNSLDTSVVSPLANVTNGWRKIAAPGNCGHATNMLYRFAPGTYYWSVQAVDGGFAGGAWAPEQTFTITNAEQPVLTLGNAINSLTPFVISNQTVTNYQNAQALLGASTIQSNITSSTLLLSWPARFQGWTLQQATSLNGPWISNTNIGTLNGQWSALLPNSSNAMYFRLVK